MNPSRDILDRLAKLDTAVVQYRRERELAQEAAAEAVQLSLEAVRSLVGIVQDRPLLQGLPNLGGAQNLAFHGVRVRSLRPDEPLKLEPHESLCLNNRLDLVWVRFSVTQDGWSKRDVDPTEILAQDTINVAAAISAALDYHLAHCAVLRTRYKRHQEIAKIAKDYAAMVAAERREEVL